MSSTKLTLPASAQRVLAIATAGALLPLGLAGAASAQTAPTLVDITKNACPTDQVKAQGYTDIAGVSSENQLAINCIAEYGIAKGTTTTTYSPTLGISRAQMALFLARYLDYAGETADASDAGFTDIAGLSQEARNAINTVANAGIALGKTATTYSPTDGVSRAQMASFINRLQAEIEGTTSSSFDTSTDYFGDDDGLGAEDDINALAGAGIAGGTGNGNYSPTLGVSRAQMALFIARSLEVNVAAGNIDSAYAPAVAPLESLAITPKDAVSQVVTANPATGSDDSTADNRQYIISGLTDTTQYRISLVKAGNVTRDAAGNAVFAIDRTAVAVSTTNPQGAMGQQASGNYLAATGNPTADIISVNGIAPVDNTGNGTTSTPNVGNDSGSVVVNSVNGSITIVIDGDTAESVVPVVYQNGGAGRTNAQGGASPRLELDSTGKPVESVGVGGVTPYTCPAAASTANSGTITVASVAKDVNQFAGSTTTTTTSGTTATTSQNYAYDANDTFSVGGVPATLDEFEAALSRNDTVTASPYSGNAALQSNFALTDSNPQPPTAVTAARKAGAANSNDVVVTIIGNNLNNDDDGDGNTATVGPFTGSYQIQRAAVTGGTDNGTDGTLGAYTTIATAATDGDTTAGFQYTDNDTTPGTYRYRVATVQDGDTSTYTGSNNVTTTAPAAADTTAPTAADTRIQTNAGSPFLLETGDTFTVAASEVVTVAPNAAFRVSSSGTPSTVDLVNGGNATFTLNTAQVIIGGVTYPANTVITVALTGAGVSVSLPSSITISSGIVDTSGNNLNVAGSADVNIDTETASPGDTTAPAADTTAPTFTAVEAGAVVTFTANEAINAATVDQDATGGFEDFLDEAIGANIQSVSVTGQVITVTFASDPSGGRLTLLADTVADTAGNLGPDAAVVVTLT